MESRRRLSRREFLDAAGKMGSAFALYPLLGPLLKVKGKMKKRVKSMKLGSTKVSISVYKKGDSKITYFCPHANEPGSVKAAKKIVNENGGTLVEVNNDMKRSVVFSIDGVKYAFDPNRVFTNEGIKLSLLKWGKIKYKDENRYSEDAHAAVKAYSEFLKSELSGSEIIIGVHNNSDGEGVTEEEMDAGDSYRNPDMDSDNFYLVIDKKHFEYFKEKKLNVIYESENADDDGSVSIYCREKCIPYINVETQYKQLQNQLDMLREALEMIRQFYGI